MLFSDVMSDGWSSVLRYPDFGSLVSLSDYNAFGTLGKFGFFKGGFIKGRFAQVSHALLYRRHQIQLHGLARSSLLWGAAGLNVLVRPRIRMSCMNAPQLLERAGRSNRASSKARTHAVLGKCVSVRVLPGGCRPKQNKK